ncbi:hypothetical protein [Clostridium minihomine]|uniref:hypothetical protein n=1 Tax=Clostridium minihomine TaxID=2045012 RepID=UPI001FB2A0CF
MSQQNKFDPAYLPTMEEMQSWYNNELRQNAVQSSEDEKDILTNETRSFFHAFRKLEKRENVQPVTAAPDNVYYQKYKAYVEQESENKYCQIQELENLIQYHEFFLRWERRLNREIRKSKHYGSNSATRYRVDCITQLKTELALLLERSPEAWAVYYKRQLLSDIKTQHQQRLVTVPYVKNAKQKVIDSLNLGVPVYIVGHLGSGKTQLATEAALDFTIQNKIQKELEESLEQWYCSNPSATEADAIQKFKELNEDRKNHYETLLASGSKEEVESLQPLFISGSHNLTYEDMFVEKTLYLKQSFSHGSFVDYLNSIIDDFDQWMGDHRERLSQMTNEEQLQLKIQIWKSFSDLLVASNSAFGTEIRKTEREILMAVKEGRPVIVDELNTIAMQNLIALNDILQRHAGSTAYITGVGPVLIKPGFAFIGTGNLSTQMVHYEGTNELNPAFKSRFVTLEYNYVPQKITGALEDQEFPEQNELFRIIIARLTDQAGRLPLPDPKRTLEELFRFSQLCRVTQNVFMGKWKDPDDPQDANTEELELRESVLSIRNILHVLDNWNLGEEKDLSKALWDGFISSITYADDQNYILSQAVRFGFFPAAEGWNIQSKGIGAATTAYDETRTRPYHYIRPAMETLSTLDVVHLLFGAGPSRKALPNELKEIFESSPEDALRINVQKYQDFDQKVSHLEHSKALLEYLENSGEKP